MKRVLQHEANQHPRAAAAYRPLLFGPYSQALQDQYPIAGVEFDVMHSYMDLREIPENVSKGIHYPYTYLSTAQICQFASLPLDFQKKFRPNVRCGQDCMRNAVTYRTRHGNRYAKVGKTVYYRSALPQLEVNGAYRAIYFPMELGVDL